ncbi:MAG TPA: PaaI family thioesterase, partial [Burkholderiales bacterium]|nr:PaaI family thioesterase [Burkholderiales bacterium]
MNRSLSVSWQDPKQLAQAARSMAGIEFLRGIRDRTLPAPPIAVLLGFDLIEVELGHAVFEITPGERHYNPIGVVHGGLAMTLLDSCMGCAVQTHMPAGSGYTTLEAKTNLVRAITSETGKLRAIGRTLHVGKRMATAEGR